MALTYRNCRGQTYYVFEGQTKTGKSKYFASKKSTSEKGVPVDSLPEGFEIHEQLSNATVTIRKIKPSRVLPAERELVEAMVRELSDYSAAKAVIEGERIDVYTRNNEFDNETATRAFGLFAARIMSDAVQHGQSSTELRFVLANNPSAADVRLWRAERFCYRGSVDRWIQLSGPAALEDLVREFAPHLGNDSFFDLI